MCITGRDIMVRKAYREEIHRQAEPWHILRDNGSTMDRALTVYRVTMLQIGIWLETVGSRLKARYTAPQLEAVFSGSLEGRLQSC